MNKTRTFNFSKFLKLNTLIALKLLIKNISELPTSLKIYISACIIFLLAAAVHGHSLDELLFIAGCFTMVSVLPYWNHHGHGDID